MRAASALCALLLAIGCGPSPAPSGPTPVAPAIRVLMLTATVGFRHDSISAAGEVMSSLSSAGGFTVSVTEDLARLNPDALAEVDVVMYALTSGDLPFSDSQRAALLDAIRGGKGFIGIHSATDTSRDWPDYGRLVGAYVTDHPWTQSARVIVEEPTHPAAGVREGFSIEEEFYVFAENPRPFVQVLMRLDAASVGAAGDYPLVWTQTFGSGRVYYNALGHFASTWRDSRFQSQLTAAVRWTAGR